MTRSRTGWYWLMGMALCACPLGFGGAAGQATAQVAEITPGRVAADMVSRSDPTQRYALYVPSAYEPERAWPVVLILDPRGRALNPLGRFKDAAERLGYVLISSYNTLSDGATEPNEAAVAAMIQDVQELVSVDTQRLYFAGFSGTARLSWIFGERVADYTAGVIGFGAGLPSDNWLMNLLLRSEPPFAYYGGAGELDFNFEELWELDWALDSRDLPHTIDFYEGPHAWPPAEVFERALEWMEVQSIRSGLRDPDMALLTVLQEKRLERASALEDDQQVHAAALSYRDIVADFTDLLDVEFAQRRAEDLTRSRAFRDRDSAIRTEVEERSEFEGRVAELLNGLRGNDRPLDVDEAVRRLGLDEVLERASGTEDREDAAAAQRMLASLFSFVSFYEPREYMQTGRFDVAVTLYQIAELIRSGTPRVCLGLGRALAQLGELDRAFEALNCVVKSGAVGSSALESDELLMPLRDDGRWADLLGRLR
jgi:predicted esterase